MHRFGFITLISFLLPTLAFSQITEACPAKELCPQLVTSIIDCKAGKHCDSFIALLKKLELPYNCHKPFEKNTSPALMLCQTDPRMAFPADEAFQLLAQLKTPEAQEYYCHGHFPMDEGMTETYHDTAGFTALLAKDKKTLSDEEKELVEQRDYFSKLTDCVEYDKQRH